MYLKKICILFLVLLMSVMTAVSQQTPTTRVSDINGTAWLEIDDTQRSSVIFGYLVAMSTLADFSSDFIEKVAEIREQKPEAAGVLTVTMQNLRQWANYPFTVREISDKVTLFYLRQKENEEYPVFLIIPWVCDKEWW